MWREPFGRASFARLPAPRLVEGNASRYGWDPELPTVHFRFSADDNVASFSINYRLVAANIREPKTGVLHVKLSVAKTDAPPLPGPPTED